MKNFDTFNRHFYESGPTRPRADIEVMRKDLTA